MKLRFAIHANVVPGEGRRMRQIRDLYLMFDIPQAVEEMGRDLFAELPSAQLGNRDQQPVTEQFILLQ